MKLSKPQLKALLAAKQCVHHTEIALNGNKARTYLSLLRHKLVEWDGFSYLRLTLAGAAELKNRDLWK